MKPRVLVADVHALSRAGIRIALERDGFDVSAEVSTASAALEAAVEQVPDVCLLDVDMPGGGIAAARAIAERLPGTSVVMIADAASEEGLLEALRAGARGYLPKDMDPSRLPHALRGVLKGEAAIPRALVGRLADAIHRRDRVRRSPELERLGVHLTTRELDVLEGMRAGDGTAEIAERLSISAVTVRRHISEILRKLGARDRQDALRRIHGVQL